MKDSRVKSFIVVGVIYALAIAVGIVSYILLPIESVFLKLLLADVIATVFTFIFSVILKNASVYDPYWSVQPLVIVLCFAIGKELTVMRILILIAVFYWGIRLTANWAYTFHGLNHQDWRYTMLNEKTGKLYPVINFLGIHMFPTLVVYLCCLPAVYAFINDLDVTVFSVLFILVSCGAATLQLVADIQMQSFRNSKVGGFIRKGLWKYSRHPNYLGEILMWWGIALAVICAVPSAWYLALGALVNTLMFLIVSIPMADKRQSRKDGFTEYKKATRMLLPIKK
ncbi:MAG: DUF1295 domain-containing protein [Clostridiales bacterium]|nr:DUF1295 domain-containing protein [Clostridiales bacterium]MBE5754793.1 DUF1295 domain-containing protein [Clostridiales bacterium]